MSPFVSLYTRALVKPRRTFEALLAEPHRPRYAAYAVATTSVTYVLVYFFLSRNGGRPTVFHPWLAIPAETYYQYNLYLVVPSILLAWISAAGFTQLMARAFGGDGSYEDTLTMLGFGLSLSTWWTALHDLITAFLGYLGVMNQRAYEDAMSTPTPFRAMLWMLMTGYTVWFVLTFTNSVRVVHRLRVVPAAIAGTFGFVVYQLVFVIFNR